MKPYLVDVPVKINIWIRPECQKRQFEVIKKARPSILFLVSDGGRNEQEQKLIAENRKLYENIDWECTVYKIYEQENQGMYTMAQKSRELIWSKVDRCIFLEDDIIPSVSFFRYCSEMLERYKDDLRVHIVNGMNHLGVYEEVNTDYFFSSFGSIWGFATWKRVFDAFGDFEYAKDNYVMKNLLSNAKEHPKLCKSIQGYPNGELVDGHPAGGEFYFALAVYLQNQLNIIPKKNMINNIGCTDDAAHSNALKKLPKGIHQVFNMKTYEIEFPLKHLDYVIPDYNYEKKQKRIMARNHPMVQFYRKIEFVIRSIYYGDAKKIIDKVIGKLKREKKIER